VVEEIDLEVSTVDSGLPQLSCKRIRDVARNIIGARYYRGIGAGGKCHGNQSFESHSEEEGRNTMPTQSIRTIQYNTGFEERGSHEVVRRQSMILLERGYPPYIYKEGWTSGSPYAYMPSTPITTQRKYRASSVMGRLDI
jgi:hypothetical protein